MYGSRTSKNTLRTSAAWNLLKMGPNNRSRRLVTTQNSTQTPANIWKCDLARSIRGCLTSGDSLKSVVFSGAFSTAIFTYRINSLAIHSSSSVRLSLFRKPGCFDRSLYPFGLRRRSSCDLIVFS